MYRAESETRLDVNRARADTRTSDGLIHLNNAGCSLPPAVVTDTIIDYLRVEEQLGGYEAREARSDQIAGVYESVATLIGADSSEIALTDSATKGWDMVFYGMRFRRGDRILTCKSEYGSNAIAYLHQAKKNGVEVVVIDDDPTGQIDLRALERELTDDSVRLVSLNHVPTQGGLINPAEEIGELAQAAGVPFLLDACQSVGQLELDVSQLKCDVLTGTGRKYLRGPRGTGFLYVRSSSMDMFEPAFLDNRSATWTSPTDYELESGALRYETWEKNYAALVGLGAAVDYALDIGVREIETRVLSLGSYLRQSLRTVPGLILRDRGSRLCGIVSFTIEGISNEQIQSHLKARQINVSVSRAPSSRWDLPERGLASVVRASVHYFNTADELDEVVASLLQLRKEVLL